MAQRKLLFISSDGVFEEHSEANDSAQFKTLLVTDAPTTDYMVVNKAALDQAVRGADWQESVLGRLDTPPGSPSTGDRYIVIATASGDWTGHEDDIAEWNGTSWDFFTPNEGWATWVENEDTAYSFNGTAWVKMAGIFNHNDLANIQGGTTAEYYHMTSAEDTWLGTVSADILATNVADLSDDESVTGAWSFATGHLRLPSAANPSPSAGDIYFDDTSDKLYVYNGSTYVEIGGDVSNTYQSFTAGTGGVSKGSVVYISANDTATKAIATALSTARVIGVSNEAISAGNPAKIAMQGSIVTGILSGANAGQVYYLSDTVAGGLVAPGSRPTAAGTVVIAIGIAVNATDLLVQIQFIKVNS